MNKRIKIFITSWYRRHFTDKVIKHINERTTKGSFEIHVYDNGSDNETQIFLKNLRDKGAISFLEQRQENTGCTENKKYFSSKLDSEDEYFVITDNDILPPDLTPDWLEQMIKIMEAHPEVAFLTPQLPPIWLQEPKEKRGDIVLCNYVGNTFKLVRREADLELQSQINKIGLERYGDDGLFSKIIRDSGWKVAFCSNIFCYNMERTEPFYGYTEEQFYEDPRKIFYDKDPMKFNYVKDERTLRPPELLIFPSGTSSEYYDLIEKPSRIIEKPARRWLIPELVL